MPACEGKIKFLSRLPLYETEKPFYVSVAPGVDFNEEKHSNLKFEVQNVKITDIRPNLADFCLDQCGFQILQHESTISELKTKSDVAAYKQEAQEFLKNVFKAEHVFCWDFRVRRNVGIERSTIDLHNEMEIDTPLREAHNDYTWQSGPVIIKRLLREHGYEQYLGPGYRFRIVNFWRSCLPVVEDNPLAWCDARSLSSADVVACDRVRPDRTGEVFYVHFNPDQEWYYLDSMTASEPAMFVTYDSAAGSHARIAPHSSFVPSVNVSNAATPRHSVETRHVVITKCPGFGQ